MPIVVTTPQSTQQALSVDWADITNKPQSYPPSIHGVTHISTGGDPIPIVSATASGLVPTLPQNFPPAGAFNMYFAGDGLWHDVADVRSAIVTNAGAGLVPQLPADSTKYFNGGSPAAYKQVDFSELSGKPATYPSDWNTTANKPATYPSDWNTTANKPGAFQPIAHAASHITGGTDVIPSASVTAAGLLNAVSGKTTDFVDGTNHCQDLVTAIQPTIWLARLRSFNAIGNPNAECDQRNAGNGVNMAAGNVSVWACDRWLATKSAATMNTSVGQSAPTPILLPGTNFAISSRSFYIQLNTQQASLAAGEYLQIYQQVEGPRLRELISGVHSISILAFCNNALTFTIYLRTPGTPLYTLTKTCVLPANTWTLFTLPNLPVWTPSATWPLVPGGAGYIYGIGLAAGTTYTSPANDTWQSGNFVCGPGTTNFGSLPVGTLLQFAFVQHEPGPFCTTFIDKPFTQNLDECLRYYQKSYPYGVRGGTVSSAGAIGCVTMGSVHPYYPIRFPKPMVIAPTIIPYSSQTGAGNAVYDANAAIDRALGAVNLPGETGYAGLGLASLNTQSTNYYWQHVADTSW